jgi:hypothetical protein
VLEAAQEELRAVLGQRTIEDALDLVLAFGPHLLPRELTIESDAHRQILPSTLDVESIQRPDCGWRGGGGGWRLVALRLTQVEPPEAPPCRSG